MEIEQNLEIGQNLEIEQKLEIGQKFGNWSKSRNLISNFMIDNFTNNYGIGGI